MTYKYYIVFTYRMPPMATMFGCKEVTLDGPLEESDRRKELAASLALEFPNLVIVNWRRVD